MKKLLLILSLLWLNAITAQCPPGDIVFNIQGQINAFITQYPNCTAIQGNLMIDSNNTQLLNLDALQNITTVHGDFTIYGSKITNINGLSNLTTVDGNFTIDNVEIPDISPFSNLEYVGGDFFLSRDSPVYNFNIQEVGGNFTLKNNLISNLSLPLTSIGNDFVLDCANMQTLDISGLSTLPGMLTLKNCKLPDLNCFSHLTEVKEQITLNIPYANNIDGLSGLDVIHGIALKGNNLDLSLFENYTSIDGVLELTLTGNTNLQGLSTITSVKGLTIEGCTNLVNFTGLDNLTATNGPIEIYSNPNLESFEGLGALKTVGGGLLISENASLIDISEISYVDPYSVWSLLITYNENLSECSLPLICSFISMDLEYISDNKTGCNTSSELAQSCANAVNSISGYVYTTIGSNCSGGAPAQGVKIKCVSFEGDTYVTFTNNETGRYKFVVPIGQYTISASDDAPGFTFLTPSYSENFTDYGNTVTHDFCMVSAPNENKIELNIVALDNPSPGKIAKYSVSYRNIGTNDISAPSIKVVFNPEYLEGSTEWVHEGVLKPLQTGYYILSLYVKESPIVNNWDEISFTISMNQQPGITPIIAEPQTMKQRVYNSANYDYFTMFVSEGSQVLIEDKDKFLHYAMFPSYPNVGSDNILDDKLDMDTFKLLYYSYSNEKDNNIMIRNNIVFVKSSGWYTYIIKPKSSIQAEDIIYAQAKSRTFEWYTDVAKTKFVEVIVLGNEEQVGDSKKLFVYPNPTNDLLNFESSEVITGVILFNSMGQEVNRFSGDRITQINVSGLAKGIYICQIQDSNGKIATRKIIVN